MYQPAIFREDRIEVMHELVRSNPLAMMVTLQSGKLAADQLPLVLHATEGLGKLRGHIAALNPMSQECADGQEVLAVFQGPQAYITPSWYPSKREHGKVVPTWNYVTVQARGTLTFHRKPSRILEHLVALTEQNEGQREMPWAVSDAPEDFVNRQIRGIVGLEIEITSLDGKWKVSQNKDARDRDGVVGGLQSEGRDEAARLVRGRT